MKSILIIGLGRFGRHLCRKFMSLNNEVMIVDRDEAAVTALADEVTSAQIADCTDENALRALGAEVTERGGDIVCCAHDLKGRRILLPFPSVGATENAMLAACAAAGETVLGYANFLHVLDEGDIGNVAVAPVNQNPFELFVEHAHLVEVARLPIIGLLVAAHGVFRPIHAVLEVLVRLDLVHADGNFVIGFAQQRLDPRLELQNIKRLREIVIRPVVKAEEFIHVIGLRG